MMLWDIIRDWFVMNVWGGNLSTGQQFVANVGRGYNVANDEGYSLLTNSFYLPIKGFDDSASVVIDHICLGDWLSTTSTIIVLVAISVALYFLVRYFFRMFAGLLSGR